MASLISGFEYDIFISYNQKDNKGERWVNEFVSNLYSHTGHEAYDKYLNAEKR
jgi:hypothetical protein